MTFVLEVPLDIVDHIRWYIWFIEVQDLDEYMVLFYVSDVPTERLTPMLEHL